MQIDIPLYLSIGLVLCTIYTLIIFYFSTKPPKVLLVLLALWIILQSTLTLIGFYQETHTLPPRIIFLVPPLILVILLAFNTNKGKLFIDQINLEHMKWVHLVRIPVELILFSLFIHKFIPEIMTFSGWNLDIISGSIPFLILVLTNKESRSKKSLLLINFVGLGLLVNIIFIAIFSAPFPFQLFGFDQPNIAILSFPFVWLPTIIVPIVLFTHIASIRQLLKNTNTYQVQ